MMTTSTTRSATAALLASNRGREEPLQPHQQEQQEQQQQEEEEQGGTKQGQASDNAQQRQDSGYAGMSPESTSSPPSPPPTFDDEEAASTTTTQQEAEPQPQDQEQEQDDDGEEDEEEEEELEPQPQPQPQQQEEPSAPTATVDASTPPTPEWEVPQTFVIVCVAVEHMKTAAVVDEHPSVPVTEVQTPDLADHARCQRQLLEQRFLGKTCGAPADEQQQEAPSLRSILRVAGTDARQKNDYKKMVVFFEHVMVALPDADTEMDYDKVRKEGSIRLNDLEHWRFKKMNVERDIVWSLCHKQCTVAQKPVIEDDEAVFTLAKQAHAAVDAMHSAWEQRKREVAEEKERLDDSKHLDMQLRTALANALWGFSTAVTVYEDGAVEAVEEVEAENEQDEVAHEQDDGEEEQEEDFDDDFDGIVFAAPPCVDDDDDDDGWADDWGYEGKGGADSSSDDDDDDEEEEEEEEDSDDEEDGVAVGAGFSVMSLFVRPSDVGGAVGDDDDDEEGDDDSDWDSDAWGSDASDDEDDEDEE